ncbi:MAG: ABC transporter ATP-binding protein [Dehalococcoidales bacterium]|nr:ABC transporter ATP-binding protein [Dehalococcoidales bacterium]
MSETNRAVIETHELTKYYGSKRGVVNLDLTIEEGEIFGFLGPNGAGKTTAIRLLLGLMKPSKGNIDILGKGLTCHRKEILNDVGYLPGDFGFYGELSGKDFVKHLLNIRGLQDNKQAIDKKVELVRRFGFDLEGKIKTYSKGMKQIVGIIQAFCHGPGLVILDEPTSGLDPLVQEEFYELLLQEKQQGTTIFLSSHILKEVEKVCDRVGIIKEGKLVFVEDLKTYRSLAGKKITLDLEKGDFPGILNRLKNDFDIEEISCSEKRLEFFYKGNIRKLLEHIDTIPITDILIEVPDLEDYFLTYYKKEGENA